MNENKIPIVVVPKRTGQVQQQTNIQKPESTMFRKVQIVKKLEVQQEQKSESSEQSLRAKEEDPEFSNLDQRMQIEEQSSNVKGEITKEQDPFLNFVNSYSLFINDASSANLDLDAVLTNLNEAIEQCKPPINDPMFNQFHQELIIQPESINKLAGQLKQLSDQKLYQCVQDVEKLNVKLLLDYNIEVKKGNQMGIIKGDDTIK